MQKAKTFFLVSLGILALGGAFQMGARLAHGQGAIAHQLTMPPPGHADLHPTFSPDGSRVAFGRQAFSGGTDLMVTDAQTGTTNLLASRSELPANWSPNGGISWSPDGTRIAIYDDGTRAVWIVDLTGQPVQTTETTWGRIKAERR